MCCARNKCLTMLSKCCGVFCRVQISYVVLELCLLGLGLELVIGVRMMMIGIPVYWRMGMAFPNIHSLNNKMLGQRRGTMRHTVSVEILSNAQLYEKPLCKDIHCMHDLEGHSLWPELPLCDGPYVTSY